MPDFECRIGEDAGFKSPVADGSHGVVLTKVNSRRCPWNCRDGIVGSTVMGTRKRCGYCRGKGFEVLECEDVTTADVAMAAEHAQFAIAESS